MLRLVEFTLIVVIATSQLPGGTDLWPLLLLSKSVASFCLFFFNYVGLLDGQSFLVLSVCEMAFSFFFLFSSKPLPQIRNH